MGRYSLTADKELAEEIGKNLETHRKRNKLKISDVGKAIGSSASYITRLEKGNRLASITVYYALAEVYGIKITDIIPV